MALEWVEKEPRTPAPFILSGCVFLVPFDLQEYCVLCEFYNSTWGIFI